MQPAPQLELLKRTSVCITHAGLNTVLESLAQGVPQVAIPVAYDQPGVAARIAEKQTGVVTSLDKLTVDHLSTLLNEVLSNCTYRDNAHKLQRAIAQGQRAFCRRRYSRRVPMNLHCYLADSIPILGFYTVEDLPISKFGIQL